MKKLVVFLVSIIGAVALGSSLWGRVLAAPALTNAGLTVEKGGSEIISNAVLSVSDNEIEPDPDYTYTVTDLPQNGVLALNSSPLTIDSTFTQSDIDSEALTYTHDGTDTISDAFTFNVSDTGGPIFTDQIFQITIHVPPVIGNDPGDFEIEFEENSKNNGDVILTITVNDVEVDDSNDELTFSLTGGNTNNAFAIVKTGVKAAEIRVANSSQLDYELNPTFELEVTVEDSHGLSDTATIEIELLDVNEAPVIAPGQTFSSNENRSVNAFVGTVNFTDPDPGDTHNFEITSGNEPGSPFKIDDGGVIRVNNAILNYEEKNSYTLGILVTDNGDGNLSDQKTVTIQINNVNEHPTIDAGQSFNVNENSPINTTVGTVQITDPDIGDTHTFTIRNGNEPNNPFTINNSGVIQVNNPVLNYENKNSYSLLIRVRDSGGLEDEETVTIIINDVNEAPVITPGQSFDVDENSPINTVVGTVAFTDPDAGDSHSFAIINGNEPGDPFKIDNNGMIQVNQAILDYETKNSYPLTIRVTDNAGLWDEEIVTIEINDVNEPPEIDAGQSFDIDENSPINTTVGTVTFTDPDEGDTFTFAIFSGNEPGEPFKINNSGVIQVNNAILDFETKSSYTLGIRITDSGGEQDEATVTVQINDVNEKPVIVAGQTFSINENSPVNETVGTVAFNDPDEGDTHTFEILTGNEPNQPFKINNSGVIQVNNAVLDFEAKSSYTLGIKVTDSGNPGLSDQKSVTVQIIDVNEKPTIAAGQSFSVVGFSDNGTVVGTVVASDPDAGDTLTYSITGGNTLGAFAINAGNGRITVNNSDALDFDVRPTFNLSVRVTDNGGLSDTKTVVINITEPPIYTIMLPFVSAARSEEPNNSCSQAYPILLNTTYNTFLPNDQNDFYRFTLASARNVTVELSNFVPINGQILLYRGTCGALTLLGNNGNFSPTKVINAGMQPAGTYHIWIIKDGPSSTTPYNLRVNATP